ncbi:MAG TPA: HAMP domain-containing sensor histidine kinase [Polyangiaceae bacterium]|nr:HAMP domain-containing sensor histidine kinase [Polyangiaceae bacterium]
MTMNTMGALERREARHAAHRVQRAALFDAEGGLVWSSAIEPPRELAAPCSASRLALSYRDLIEQWFSASAAIGSPHEVDGRGLDWDVERDLEIATRTGQRLRIVQRRTPDGGTLALLVDQSSEERPGPAPESAGSSSDAMRLAITETMSWLSRELRTPLNSILGFAQLMQRDEKDPLAARHRPRADEIVKGGEQVVALLDQLLELCRDQLDQVALALAPTDARSVVEAARARLAPLAARAGVELRTIASEVADIPLVHVDPARLLHIVTTLGERAIEQQSAPATVSVTLSVPREGVARINVADNGGGIHPDAQANLFLPLRRVRGSDGIEAAGLPLAIAHRLAELMHCQLRFRSVWTQGTDFWIDIPAWSASR